MSLTAALARVSVKVVRKDNMHKVLTNYRVWFIHTGTYYGIEEFDSSKGSWEPTPYNQEVIDCATTELGRLFPKKGGE